MPQARPKTRCNTRSTPILSQIASQNIEKNLTKDRAIPTLAAALFYGTPMSRLLTALSAIVLTFGCLATSTAHAQPACGNTAEADVVIMIDLSGGMTAENIAAQKAAATELLDFFDSAPHKPRVAVGTFNTVCFSYGECYPVPPSPESRIVTPLSVNYTDAYTALSAGPGGIVGEGPGGAGLGGTNIASALNLAQSHIEGSGDPDTPNYVVIISDGDPNFPGYYQSFECGNCWCPQAENAGVAAANALKSAGTGIFTIHFGATSCGGATYMAGISSGPGFSFSGGENLEGIFDEISRIITCDDGNVCTQDSCNEQTGLCEFIDICPEPTPTPTPTPTASPTPGPVGDCDQVDITGYKSALGTIANNQDSQLRRLLRELNLRKPHCKNPNRVKSFVKNTKKLLAPTLDSNLAQTAGLPFVVLQCQGVLGCSSTAVPLDINSYGTNSNLIRDLTLKAINLKRTCYSGACEGDAIECKRRIETRRKQIRKDRKLANDLHNGNLFNLSSVPTTTYQCG